MNTLKNILAGMLIICFCTAVFNPAAVSAEEELELTAAAAVLIEAQTGMVLYEKNATEPMPPASLTKIMTLLVAMEELKKGRVDWDTPITASQKAWEVSDYGNTSTMFLNIGQQATFREMIKGIAIVSANDACVAVAEHLFGSEEAFVQQMNRRAKELGLENTHFVNSHGLHDPDQYMSALDIARLSAYFIQTQPEAAAYQAEREFTFNDIRQFNRNPLLGSYPGADGIKTGSTPQAGYCLAATSEQQGIRLISVVLNTPGMRERGLDSEVLLNYGFRNYKLLTLYDAGEPVAHAAVSRGREREVPLVARRPVAAVVPREDEHYNIEQVLLLDEPLAAPVEEGQSAGAIQLIDPEGNVIDEVELFVAQTVERLGFFRSILRSIGDFFAGLWNRVWSNEE